MSITYITGNAELLSRIEPLWEKQRDYHSEMSTYFGSDINEMTFTERFQTISESPEFIEYFIIIAVEKKRDVGFVVNSIRTDDIGMIHSLYILPDYRHRKIATQLMKRSMEWLKGKVTKIQLIVSVGNEKVLKFYRRFGFFPKNIRMEYKPVTVGSTH